MENRKLKTFEHLSERVDSQKIIEMLKKDENGKSARP